MGGLWSSFARRLGKKFQPAFKSIEPASKVLLGRGRRSFVRAVARTTSCQ